MASHLTRRPLPALIALVALLLFTALVWWRVLHRSDGKATACPTSTTSTSASPVASALPAPGEVTVWLLNSTNRGGIAAKARTVLIGAGFNSPKQAANDKQHKVRGVAEIRFGPAVAKGARLLSFYFPGATLVPNAADKSTTIVVSLGSKYTKVASAQSVKAALARQHLVTTSPSPTPTGTPSC